MVRCLEGREACVQHNSFRNEVLAILGTRNLTARYQPLVDLVSGRIEGHEGLVRGPSDSVLHPPLNLLRAARENGLQVPMEEACLARVIQGAGALATAERRLFLNVSPDCLADLVDPLFQEVARAGIPPERVVLELTETPPGGRPEDLSRAVQIVREAGFLLALDDLGEGMSSLRMWLDLRPDFVKVDKGFVQGVAEDATRLTFLRSLATLGHAMGCRMVAEGIETEADLAVVKDLGMDLGQGYLLGRPSTVPVLEGPSGLAWPVAAPLPYQGTAQAGSLLRAIAPVAPATPCQEVLARFRQDPGLQSLPVVEDGLPVGLLHRPAFTETMARPFSRELYGKRPCEVHMVRSILVLDHRVSLTELSRLVTDSDPQHILHGFILTRDGRYAGMGSGHDLMREMTRLQVRAARQANPLTGLPGNVPLQEHLESLLARGQAFQACYADLDHFKPYNDVYGFQRGDEVIQALGRLLQSHVDPERDFIGHIGGDDFLVVFRSPDWETRCETLLAAFEARRADWFQPEHLATEGYTAEDRTGRLVKHPLLSLSLGVVRVPAGSPLSRHEVAEAASGAKRMAKKMPGNSLFLERRG